MTRFIPQEVLDDIRSKTNIVDVIGQYVQLKKSGKNYSGLCPFHDEKTPSFSVAEDKQIFHCFGCGKGGNVFSFIQEIEGISFPESVERVAKLEDIQLASEWVSQPSVETPQNIKQRQLIQMHEKAQEIYHHLLINTKVGEQALEYLLERGLTMAIIEEFQIGFAPNQRQFLTQVFANEDFDKSLYGETGLFIERENQEMIDRFYQRIMFPITDFQGRTIGFSGRLLPIDKEVDKSQPKYLNSPETELFNKRNVLFNFHRGRPVIRKEQEVFLFEGFMDVIAAYQAGIKNGIASMGTSLTTQQIAAIQRVTKRLVLCYDGDTAGVEATNRGIELLQEHSQLELAIVSIPEKLDPDDYFRKYGSEAFVELALHGRQTIFAFKMRYLKQERNLHNEKEKLDYVEELLKELAQIPSPIEQDMYLTQLSNEFQLSRESLQKQLRLQKRTVRQESRSLPTPQPSFSEPLAPERQQPLTQVEKAEEMLLYRLFNEQGVRNRLKTENFQFVHDVYQEVYLLLDSFLMTHQQFELADFLDFLKNDHLKQLVIKIAYLSMAEESSEQEIQDILQVISRSSLTDEINVKKIQQQEARENGNQQLEFELAIDIINLTKQLKQA